ncbi:MAG TPA: murein biosynthesis integral membrane protein MurJ [Thermomicrobiales bacterium]|nr:murein biosynthesis integral membrane protein MurJ [Thermomicrobiales bacterium]
MASAPLAADARERAPLLLGGYAALAEGAWMGAAQATEALEPARAALPARARVRLAGLFRRELGAAEAALVLMASFLCSALLGAVRQVLFNAQFGAGPEANAYYAAFRLPDTLFSLIAGGALSGAMIPVLVAAEREEGEAAARRLANLVLTALLVVFAVATLAGELLAPAFVRDLLAPGFDAQTSALTVSLTRLMLAQPLVLAVGSVATAVLNGRSRFLLTAISVAAHNIGLIAGILAARLDPALGIAGPALGVVAGALLQVLIVLPGLVGGGRRVRPAWDPRDARLREVVRLLIPNGLAVGVGYAGFIVDTAFASEAPQAAGLAALHNAWMLAGLPVALLGQAVGQAAFPRLAARAAAGEWARLRATLGLALAAAVALALPALLGLLVLGQTAIRLLFEHGRYDAAAGALTYALLVPYALGLPAYVATEVLTRGLVALRDTRTPLFTNSAQLAARAALMAALLGRVGVLAIPIAFAAAAALEAMALGAALGLRLRRRVALAAAPVRLSGG